MVMFMFLPKMSMAGERQMVLGRGHGCGMSQHSVSSAKSSAVILFINPPTTPGVLPVTKFSWMSDFSELLAP